MNTELLNSLEYHHAEPLGQFLASETFGEHKDRAACIYKRFKRAPRKQKLLDLGICLCSMVMFSQEADQSRHQRSDSVAADLTPLPRVNDGSPTTTASCS